MTDQEQTNIPDDNRAKAKLFAHFEVIGLFDDQGNQRSGFTSLLSEGKEVFNRMQFLPQTFLPGTQIKIEVALCPSCNREALEHVDGKCVCGHDWKQWCADRYKAYETPTEPPEQANNEHQHQQNEGQEDNG